jgi:hypothetical protein
MTTMEKLQETPCVAIRKEYQECLVSNQNSRMYRKDCRPLERALEECAAIYIGKLD